MSISHAIDRASPVFAARMGVPRELEIALNAPLGPQRLAADTVVIDGDGWYRTLTPAIVDSYNSLYLKVVDVMLGLFHGTYRVFGDDRVAMVKLMWDIACYWAFFSQLSIQNFLDDEANLPRLHDLIDRLGRANERVQRAFRAADGLDREQTHKTGFFGFGGVSSVTALRATVTTPRTVEATAANIDFMAHQFAPALCRFVGVESEGGDSGAQRLIPMIETYVAPESRQIAFAVGGRA